MTRTRSLVLVCHVTHDRGHQLWIGFVSCIAKQIEPLAIGHSNGRAFRKIHVQMFSEIAPAVGYSV